MKRMLVLFIQVALVFSYILGMEETKENKGDPAANKMLMRAAIQGDMARAQEALANGADINARDEEGSEALHRAIDNRHYDMALWLIQEGAHVDDPNKDNFTPLMIAAERGWANGVRLLLERGARINVVGKVWRQTPLHLAAQVGILEPVQLLIDYGANLNSLNRYNETPLAIAARRGYLPIVQLLSQYGADINAGYGALRASQAGRHFIVSEWLIEHGANVLDESLDPLAELYVHENPLLRALAKHNFTQAKDILTAALEGEQARKALKKMFPLLVALKVDDLIDLVLTKYKHLLNAKILKRALVSAAATHNMHLFERLYEVAREILPPGRIVDILEEPLYWAAIRGYEDIVNFIVEHAFTQREAGALILSRVGQQLNNILRTNENNENIAPEWREALMRIRERIATASHIQEAVSIVPGRSRTDYAQQALSSITQQIPPELTALIFGFLLRTHPEKHHGL